jgi:DNA-binding transcriptional regulator LsrR (DeoR family)
MSFLHTHPPKPCWCGTTHTPGQAFNLNVYDRDDLPPEPYDAIAEAGVKVIEKMMKEKNTMASTGGRDLRSCIDRYGYICIGVTIDGGLDGEEYDAGATGPPLQVAEFLRDLADDIERAGQP